MANVLNMSSHLIYPHNLHNKRHFSHLKFKEVKALGDISCVHVMKTGFNLTLIERKWGWGKFMFFTYLLISSLSAFTI